MIEFFLIKQTISIFLLLHGYDIQTLCFKFVIWLNKTAKGQIYRSLLQISAHIYIHIRPPFLLFFIAVNLQLYLKKKSSSYLGEGEEWSVWAEEKGLRLGYAGGQSYQNIINRCNIAGKLKITDLASHVGPISSHPSRTLIQPPIAASIPLLKRELSNTRPVSVQPHAQELHHPSASAPKARRQGRS